jgi:2'-5' RNA ligase superfamily
MKRSSILLSSSSISGSDADQQQRRASENDHPTTTISSSTSSNVAKKNSGGMEESPAADTTSRTATNLFHDWTVCMVPPPSSTDSARSVWDALTQARQQLQDPGFYRWPPHVNLLYPFLNCYSSCNNENNTHDISTTTCQADVINHDILKSLQVACRQCAPFLVQLHQFGTFGGKKRGVLWVYPDSSSSSSSCNVTSTGSRPLESEQQDDVYDDTSISNEIEPLVELQARLQEQFPMCTDQRKVDGVFRPHMTLSHFVNLQGAQEAQKLVEAWWPTTTTTTTTPPDDTTTLATTNDNGEDSNAPQRQAAAMLEFWVDRIYLLHRQGDNGQFCIVAEIPLLGGPAALRRAPVAQPETKDTIATGDTTATAVLQVDHPPRPFAFMPETEWDWVRQARLELKARRNHRRGNSRGDNVARGRGTSARGGQGRGQEGDRRGPACVPDSPEVIAAKRAARKAKREKRAASNKQQ